MVWVGMEAAAGGWSGRGTGIGMTSAAVSTASDGARTGRSIGAGMGSAVISSASGGNGGSCANSGIAATLAGRVSGAGSALATAGAVAAPGLRATFLVCVRFRPVAQKPLARLQKCSAGEKLTRRAAVASPAAAKAMSRARAIQSGCDIDGDLTESEEHLSGL